MSARPTPEQLIDDYRVAYAAMNPGKYLAVDYFRGWFQVYTGGLTDTRVQRGKLVAMTDRLRERAKGGEA